MHGKNNEKLVYFIIQLNITHAASEQCAQRSFSESIFLSILVFEISGTQKSRNWKNVKSFVCLNRIPDRYISKFRNFDPVRSTFAVRETASLGIMGAPRVPPLNPSESIVL